MKRDVQGLTSRTFDLLVIGGGIHGAWVAWDAALRGLDVALIDAADFANATSSNSLKIIHGGLRYLQTGDIRRMRESIRERSILLRVAPHLVRPLQFLLPLYGHGTRGPLALRAGLAIADLIGIDRNSGLPPAHSLPPGRVISAGECLERVPGVPSDGLTGGAIWYDAQAYSDTRVVISVLQSAAKRGATLANYVKATELNVQNGKVVGISARDVQSGNTLDIRARVTVNAAGPWTSSIWGRTLPEQAGGHWLLSKAMNLAVPRLFGDLGVGLSTRPGGNQKGRLLFAVPWRDHTIIGTTHLPYSGHPSEYHASAVDISDFLADFNSAFPDTQLTQDDVRKVYAGLIPATRFDDVQSVKLASRHMVTRLGVIGGPRGLVTVTGVKFTTARLAAEETVDSVFEELGYARSPGCATYQTTIAGSDYTPQTSSVGVSHSIAVHLSRYYGGDAEQIISLVRSDPSLGEPLCDSSPVIEAEVIHAVRNEMAQTTDDVVHRRTDLGVNGELALDLVLACEELITRARQGFAGGAADSPVLAATPGLDGSRDETRVTLG